ncbi:MAG: M14 family zinc carboxypeptidase [Gemmatimonadota bacterium]|nr:M14 family zinc carboxypeptidase [Gemmatimonadota bacterium]
MKIKTIRGLLAPLLFFSMVFGTQAAAHPGQPDKIPGFKWHVVELEAPGSEGLEALAAQGFEIMEITPGGDARVLASDSELRRIGELGFKARILIEDYGRRLAGRRSEEPVLAASDDMLPPGSMGGYFSPEEIIAFVDSLIAIDTHGIITERVEIGRSSWDEPIWMFKVSDNPELDENEPEVFYNSLIHAREPMSVMALLYYLRYIIGNYGRVDSVTELVDSREMYFIPLVNPDGYKINWDIYQGSGGMSFGFWRKNARDNNGNGELDSFDGVDLNRNFSFKWGYDNQGSSGYTSSDSYRGPEPFSEPETVVIREFLKSRSMATAVNYHTYGNVLINPFNYLNLQTPDSALYNRLGPLLTAESGYKFGNVSQTLGSYYRANGEFTDWEYTDTTEREKIIAWTCEVGPRSYGFWPPADKVTPMAAELLPFNYTLAAVSGFWPRLDTLAVVYHGEDSSRVSLAPGVSNPGISANSEELSLKLESLSQGLEASVPAVSMPDLEPGCGASFPADSLRVFFRENSFNGSAKLALYEGDRRVRTFRVSVSRPVPSSYDVDRDGRIDIFDLLALLKALGSGVPEGCDVNSDGRVDIFDLIDLLRVL